MSATYCDAGVTPFGKEKGREKNKDNLLPCQQEHFNLLTSLDFQNFPTVRSISFLDFLAIKSSVNQQTLQNLKILSPSELQKKPKEFKSLSLSCIGTPNICLFFTVAFSAVPLTFYIPPMRNLSFFVETMEGLLRESRVYTTRFYPRARHAWSRLLDILLCNSRVE
uniref:Uncharacterized protein n=1 Tax=Salix viminalis TaxID=40686 RepID=A0A6N2LY64_SALVM